MTTATVDAKGRLAIPIELRKELGIGAGDVLFFESDAEHGVLHLAKSVNPFDGLADFARQEYLAGRTRSLRDFAAEYGIELDDPE